MNENVYYYLGDFVKYNGKIVKIETLMLDSPMIGIRFQDGTNDIVRLDQISPVELVQEMLEKWGFEYTKEDSDEILSSWNGWWIKKSLELGVCAPDDLTWPPCLYITDRTISIKYVHQVQQALRAVDEYQEEEADKIFWQC